MSNKYKYIWIGILLIVWVGYNANAQQKSNLKTRIKLNYQKNTENKIELSAKLTVKQKRYVPYAGVIAKFYNSNDSSNNLLAQVETNEQGVATFEIPDEVKIKRSDEKLMNFEVVFEGNDTTKSCRAYFGVKDAELALAFYQKDSLKFIEALVREDSSSVEGVSVLFFIKGTFSLLNFSTKETEKDGRATIEFPTNIPGDTAGIVTIVAKIRDNETYGNISTKGKINWAVPIKPIQEKHRGLGDTDAPLWMVYTLIILLSAVWFHYLFVIIQIIKIKLDSKKQGLETIMKKN